MTLTPPHDRAGVPLALGQRVRVRVELGEWRHESVRIVTALFGKHGSVEASAEETENDSMIVNGSQCEILQP